MRGVFCFKMVSFALLFCYTEKNSAQARKEGCWHGQHHHRHCGGHGFREDHPDAFDTDLMVEQIEALRRGETIACPVYDFTVHNRSSETLLIAPTSVIVLEGILIFADEKLRKLMDVKIFVDTDADVRILRRVVRDVKKRGRSLDSVVQQYLTTVKPMHEQFVEPSKRYADIIVPEGGKNLVALDMIVRRVEHHIRQHGGA